MKRGLVILGGGPAGLAAGYFARKHGLPFTIVEASGRCGGNCATVQHGDFLFDTGAHRFHDRFPDITRELLGLMGDELVHVDAPSQIYSFGKRIAFPLRPLNLALRLGPLALARAMIDFAAARLGRSSARDDFETFVVSRYGRYLAGRFLLGYSEKLWGSPTGLLDPEIAGRRLQGLDWRAFLLEAFTGWEATSRHLEGTFYYPRHGGIGAISECLLRQCGPGAVRLQAAVTRVRHGNGRITSIELNGREQLEADEVISSIPLNELIGRLEPPPPAPVAEAAQQMRFRSLLLVALFLNRPGVTADASLYFPDPGVPFTRVFEPRNRSRAMSPDGRTSLVAEIPCTWGDPLWRQSDAELQAIVRAALCRFGFLNGEEVMDGAVVRLAAAYPVLDRAAVRNRGIVNQYLRGWSNLALTGRNGQFLYTHLHDQLQRGMEIIDGLRRHSS